MKTYSLIAVAVALAACASEPPIIPPPDASAGTPDATRTSRQVEELAQTPLSDLNLVHAPIPPALLEAKRDPYAPPLENSCPSLAAQVKALDAALGADLDTPASPSNPSLLARGADLVSDGAGHAIKGAIEGLVPYRGWVRRLSGAERYSKQVAAAIAGGSVRRAYLKGLGQAAGCASPAAPFRETPKPGGT